MAIMFPYSNNQVNITLYKDIPFDNTYNHHSFITNWSYNEVDVHDGNYQQDNFINRKIGRRNNPSVTRYVYDRYNLTGYFNFAYGNGLVTSVVLELSSEQTLCNYMSVEGVDSDSTLYYFITSITQLNGDTYRLGLELDVLMTYGDEFLGGMKDIPVFTKRKHCRRVDNTGRPYSRYYANMEREFYGVKPSIIEDAIKSEPKIDGLTDEQNSLLSRVHWVYVTHTANNVNISKDYLFTQKGTEYPYFVFCLPLVEKFYIDYGNNQEIELDVFTLLNKLIGNGSVKSAKISPFPPFTSWNNSNATLDFEVNLDSTIKSLTINLINYTQVSTSPLTLTYKIGSNEFASVVWAITDNPILSGSMIITKDVDYTHEYKTLNLNFLPNLVVPSINSIISDEDLNEYKLYLRPFKEYVLKTISDSGTELRPHIWLSYHKGYNYFSYDFYTITTSQPHDYGYFTYTTTENDGYNSLDLIGISGSKNYTMPVGTNALDSFYLVNGFSYFNGKLINHLNNVNQVGGGIASFMGGGDKGRALQNIVGGAISEYSNISSMITTDTDLRNTPDTLSLGGSAYSMDMAISDTFGNYYDLYPFVLVTRCSDMIIKHAKDIYYHYGYDVNCNCYFNYDLYDDDYFSQNYNADTQIFTRTLFNYIQIEDDITNKISRNSGIPLIARQKLNEIFNKGITLWTFIGFPFTYGQPYISPTAQWHDDVEDYLFKEIYDNAEFYNQ